ncbi:replication initiator protein [Capybara microvirus Cap3_SP_470]|nr:replication initiator protein [Capybara microvirus Cap3_SP_470]
MHEAQYHSNNYFITITYDDFYLFTETDFNGNLVRSVPQVVNETGEVIMNVPSLRKRDLQLFWKRLRGTANGKNLKYFACGEYGPNTHRPHYHCCVFDLELPDLTFYKTSDTGFSLYNSEWLSNLWYSEFEDVREKDNLPVGKHFPMGFIVIGELNADTAGYTARYTLKKANDAELNSKFQDLNIEPERLYCSKGLGLNWLMDNIDTVLEVDELVLKDGFTLSAPQYYLNKLEEVGYDLTERKERNKAIAIDLSDAIYSGTTLSPDKYNKMLDEQSKQKNLSSYRPL